MLQNNNDDRYTGGQSACHHMFSLLDADQDIPWPDQPIEYTQKFRVWYQDWDPSFHTGIKYSHMSLGDNWDVGAGPNGVGAEFDVPKCSEGVAGCSLEDGHWVHTITGLWTGIGRPVVPHMHCHAPTCLSMTLYDNSTGQIICKSQAVFGGTGRVDTARMDEPGFILVPPCVWGREEDGFEAPPDLTGVDLYMVKRSNATFGAFCFDLTVCRFACCGVVATAPAPAPAPAPALGLRVRLPVQCAVPVLPGGVRVRDCFCFVLF